MNIQSANRTRGWREVIVALLLAACKTAESTPVPPDIADVTEIGRLQDSGLVEASGIVRSTLEPNVFWSQNDSGNDERLFAYDSTGRSLGSVRITGAKNRDWEAVAIGPCPQTSCAYIADVGDNGARRKSVRIFRVAEPRTTDTATAPADSLPFRYVDGPRDVESIFVTADTAIYLVTKRPERNEQQALRPVRLYRIRASSWLTPNANVVADLVDSLPIVPEPNRESTWVTDASLSAPDSAGQQALAVRAYNEVFVFRTPANSRAKYELLAHCSLRPLKERRSGEGVTWLADGRLMFNAEGRGALLHAGRCRGRAL